MTIHGWNINIQTLPGPNRDEYRWFEDEIYENKIKNMGWLVYSIAEVSMNWYVGKLAVFKNKEKPELLLNPSNLFCHGYRKTVFFSKDGEYTFIFARVYDEKHNHLEVPICIINYEKSIFTFISVVNGFHYELSEISNVEYQMRNLYSDKKFKNLDGKIINLNALKWFNIEYLNNFNELYLKEKSRNSV